jgi:signal transduction histidine kinase
LDRVVEGAVFIARAEEGGLWLLEAEADELHLKAERGLGPARQHLSLLGAEMGLVGQTLRAAEPLWLVAEGGDPDIQVTTGYEVRAFLSVPLVNKGHAVGVLSVSNRAQGRRFTSNDKALIEALADYAVIAIENARMYRATDQALAERVEEVTHLYDIARTVTCTLDPETIFDLVTAKISEMFQVEAGSLLLLDDEAQELEFVTSWMGDQEPLRGVRLKAGQGIVGQVALSHQPAVVNDAYSHSNFCSQVDRETGFVTRSILCVPLVVQDRCTGVLELLNKVDGPFTQEDVERLGNVARPVAIALENARLYREAQELHMAKSRFVSTVARELRSPLTAIKGYSSMLLSGAMGNLEGRAAEGIRKVEASTEYLIDLMEDMLDIARLETGDTRLDLQPVSIGQIVTQISSSFKQRVRDKNLRLAARVSPRLPPVYGDQDRISQILNNLVTNAYLYTLPKGRIAIEARDERNKKRPRGSGEWVVVSVSDTGIGIAAEDQDLIFKRFFRAEHPVVRHHQGRGLSLSIAKSLVELHGGRIWFESTPGVGSTFSFALPVAG